MFWLYEIKILKFKFWSIQFFKFWLKFKAEHSPLLIISCKATALHGNKASLQVTSFMAGLLGAMMFLSEQFSAQQANNHYEITISMLYIGIDWYYYEPVIICLLICKNVT